MLRFLFLVTVIFSVLLIQSCEKENTPEASVVINELMAVNSTIQADQNGEYDDWIELCNKSDLELDLSGYYLTDSRSNPVKWQFPPKTMIRAHDYLIVWADGDTLQAGLHASFKLSSSGEKLFFINRELLIIDKVEYPAQENELGYARNPDWTGSFVWQTPTWGASNNIHE